MGPCLCGAIDCPSCGPLLGGWQCHCGKWNGECEHYDENGELTEAGYKLEEAQEAYWERLIQERIDEKAFADGPSGFTDPYEETP